MNKTDYQSAFLIIYFGQLPAFFDFWAKTCEPNHKHFHWYVYNDHLKQKHELNKAVTLVPYDFTQLRTDLKELLDITIPAENTRIVCDCRPILYPLRKEKDHLEKYDLIGYSDLDVVYGKIHKFMPANALSYSIISAENNRPCGPFTLFSKNALEEICNSKQIKSRLEYDPGIETYSSCDYTDQGAAFKPMSGNTSKDRIAQSINFEHLDEATLLVELAQKHGPAMCSCDPLQPTGSRWFNHRKPIAFFENNKLYLRDNRGNKREGALFHFSRFKNRARFKIDHKVLEHKNWGIYKYGFIPLKSVFTKIKMMLTTLY